jgi:hypothetical protein
MQHVSYNGTIHTYRLIVVYYYTSLIRGFIIT